MDNDKKSYMQKLSDKILEWDEKIDELKKQGAEATSSIKGDYNKIAEDLKEKKRDAETRLKELRNVSGESWVELKKGADQAVNDLSQAVDRALSKFKKQ